MPEAVGCRYRSGSVDGCFGTRDVVAFVNQLDGLGRQHAGSWTDEMTGAERAFLEAARRAVLATTAEDGRPRLVPVCFAVLDVDGVPHVVSPLDEKPKRVSDARRLARVRDILARPAVSLLVDRWDEDWSTLAWLRLDGEALLLEPAPAPSLHAAAIQALRGRYPQYAKHGLESRPMIAVRIGGVRSWGRLEVETGG